MNTKKLTEVLAGWAGLTTEEVQRKQAREWEKAQAERRSSAARFAQYRRQELKWTAGRRVRPRQREYKPP